MSIIVPYRAEELRDSAGAFVKPDGEFIFLKKFGPIHLEYAFNYCRGPAYNSLLLSRHLEKDMSIDPFASSKLSEKDLDMFKTIKLISDYDDLEFMRMYLGWDVIRYDYYNDRIRPIILTSSPQPHVRFFNYGLMDAHFIYDGRIIDVCQDGIVWYKPTFQEIEENERYRVKIKSIKNDVSYKDRHLFFE